MSITQLEKPSSELTIYIKDVSFNVKFPTSGQMIDIAILKSKLSDNQYNSLFLQSSLEAPLALRLVDAYSFFQIMVPELKKNLTLDSFYDIEVLDSLELIEVFESQIQPWLNEWTKVINERVEELRRKDSGKRNLI